jgi:uncharacterized protein HemY
VQAEGSYDITIIGGVTTFEGGELTDDRPGRLVLPVLPAEAAAEMGGDASTADELTIERVEAQLRENLVVLSSAEMQLDAWAEGAAEADGQASRERRRRVATVRVVAPRGMTHTGHAVGSSAKL